MTLADAVKQHPVDPALITYHKQMGVGFERKTVALKMKFNNIDGKPAQPLQRIKC